VRAGSDAPDLRCGGHPVIGLQDTPLGGLTADEGAGNQLGKRYVSADGAVEVLVTSAGAGELTVDGEPMILKQSATLPSSD
jgi:hypothetical protein